MRLKGRTIVAVGVLTAGFAFATTAGAATSLSDLGILGFDDRTIDQDYSTGPGLGIAIPDNDPLGVSSTISIEDQGTIERAAVFVRVDHTYVGDLQYVLTAPSGDEIVLMDRPGVTPELEFGDSSNLTADRGVLFGEQSPVAAASLGAGCNGTDTVVGIDCVRWVLPEETLSVLAGSDIFGDWTLTIIDNAGGDEGILDGWLVSFELQSVPLPAGIWMFGPALLGLFAARRRS